MAQTTNPSLQETLAQGKYLATAADCTACHTAVGGAPYAGGYVIASPMGNIYTTNITPSKTAGIGNYTEQQFAAALRKGIKADGTYLYPAMPYTAYAKLSDADMHALYTYMMQGVQPVDTTTPKTKLPFPFNQRYAIAAWNLLYLSDKQFQPDANKSAQWNRGAYIAEALEHCSMCHSPRGFLMAEETGKAYAGGPLGAWYAPNITSDPISGIGGWSEVELVQYFQTGNVPKKAQAAGGMAEAITHSLQHLSKDDLTALAFYIKTIPAQKGTDTSRARSDFGQVYSVETSLRGNPQADAGEHLYSANCASCHQADGSGSKDGFYPTLFNNTTTGAATPNNLVAVILFGVDRQVGNTHYYMPGFQQGSYLGQLNDTQIASISNYVYQRYGNPDVKITADDVKTLRAGGPKPPLVILGSLVPPAIIICVLLLVGFAVWRFSRHEKHKHEAQHKTS